MRVWAVLVLLSAAPAAAQTTAEDRPTHAFGLTVGAGWLNAGDLGSADATVRGSGESPVDLFSTQSALGGAGAVEAAASYSLSRRVEVEGGVLFTRPELRISVTADREGAPDLLVSERLDQYLFEGRLVIALDEIGFGSRTVPFASLGGAYVRQLHEDPTLVESGAALQFGGGVKHWLALRSTGAIRAAGIRGDARLYLFSGGVSFESRARSHVALSGSFFLTF